MPTFPPKIVAPSSKTFSDFLSASTKLALSKTVPTSFPAAVAFCIDLKKVREVKARREERYRKQRLEIGRDIRFLMEKTELTEGET